jgi:hypothetical protein
MVIDVNEGYEKSSFLIERFMEGKYEKFNNNMGYVEGQEENETFDADHLAVALDDMHLNAIEEGSDDDDSSDDEIFSLMAHHEPSTVTIHNHSSSNGIADRLILQAFSHFSFERTKKLIVVDLRGVFEKEERRHSEIRIDGPCNTQKQNEKDAQI